MLFFIKVPSAWDIYIYHLNGLFLIVENWRVISISRYAHIAMGPNLFSEQNSYKGYIVDMSIISLLPTCHSLDMVLSIDHPMKESLCQSALS